MDKIRIGVICPSEIAFRRFMPALFHLSDKFVFSGIAVANKQEWSGDVKEEIIKQEISKAERFTNQYGGIIYHSYYDLITSPDIDAIYLPLPPALHYKWAKLALENKKHVFLEKPSTTCVEHTKELCSLAKQNNLAIHENYMFIYHNQIDEIKKMIDDGIVGDIRLIRGNFGFPKRPANDFRYNKALGGGALLDCGGYPIRLMQLMIGNDIHVDAAKLIFNEQDIDLYGSVQLSNESSIAQISFGMDNGYKCDLEIWGSIGTIYTGRIFSAPDSLSCEIQININNEITTKILEPDDTFRKSLVQFYQCVEEQAIRNEEYGDILRQIALVEDVILKNQVKRQL